MWRNYVCTSYTIAVIDHLHPVKYTSRDLEAGNTSEDRMIGLQGCYKSKLDLLFATQIIDSTYTSSDSSSSASIHSYKHRHRHSPLHRIGFSSSTCPCTHTACIFTLPTTSPRTFDDLGIHVASRYGHALLCIIDLQKESQNISTSSRQSITIFVIASKQSPHTKVQRKTPDL
jgi:hypothetical protein